MGRGVPEPAAVALVPGPRWPRAWQTLAWFSRPHLFLDRCHARYGDVFAIDIAFAGRWVLLAHPDLLRDVFAGEQSAFHAGDANRVLRPVLGPRSVLVLDGEDHVARRRLLRTALGGAHRAREEQLMFEIATRELGRLPVSDNVALLPRLRAATREIIASVVLGAGDDAGTEELRGALNALLEWSTSRRALGSLLLLGPDRTMRRTALPRLLARVDATLRGQIAAARRDPRLPEREDVLAQLLCARYENGEPLSDGDLRDQLVTLLVAGYETTATTLAWAVERLLRTPAASERLRSELAAGEDAYLDAVCRETLRLRPVIPIAGRTLVEPTRIGPWRFAAGTRLAPCMYLIHRRPDLYPEPELFRPERFLGGVPGGYAWIPFGGGSRRCLGAGFALAEMRAVLRAVMTLDLRAPRYRSESIRRRALVLAPARGAEVVRGRATAAALAASQERGSEASAGR